MSGPYLRDREISVDAEAIRAQVRELGAGLKAIAARLDRIEATSARSTVATERLVALLSKLAEQPPAS